MKTIFSGIVILFMIALVSSFSCNKDEQKSIDKSNTGLILFFGDPAVDGCGWVIKIDNSIYSPLELETEFKIDSLNVKIDYELLNSSFKCGWREPGYKQIKINTIVILKK